MSERAGHRNGDIYRTLTHEQAEELISARMDGPIDPIENRALLLHLRGCDACRAFAVQMEVMAREFEQLPMLPPSPAVSRQVRDRIATQSTWLPAWLQIPGPGQARAMPAVIAALVLVASVATLLLFTSGDPGQPEPTNQQRSTIDAPQSDTLAQALESQDNQATTAGAAESQPTQTVPNVTADETAVAAATGAGLPTETPRSVLPPTDPTEPAQEDEQEAPIQEPASDAPDEPTVAGDDGNEAPPPEPTEAETEDEPQLAQTETEPTATGEEPSLAFAASEEGEEGEPAIGAAGSPAESTGDESETAASEPAPASEPTTPAFTATAETEPTATVETTALPTETLEPTVTVTQTPTETASPTETARPTETATPTETPTPTPTETATASPTEEPPDIAAADSAATEPEDGNSEEPFTQPTIAPAGNSVTGNNTAAEFSSGVLSEAEEQWESAGEVAEDGGGTTQLEQSQGGDADPGVENEGISDQGDSPPIQPSGGAGGIGAAGSDPLNGEEQPIFPVGGGPEEAPVQEAPAEDGTVEPVEPPEDVQEVPEESPADVSEQPAEPAAESPEDADVTVPSGLDNASIVAPLPGGTSAPQGRLEFRVQLDLYVADSGGQMAVADQAGNILATIGSADHAIWSPAGGVLMYGTGSTVGGWDVQSGAFYTYGVPSDVAVVDVPAGWQDARAYYLRAFPDSPGQMELHSANWDGSEDVLVWSGEGLQLAGDRPLAIAGGFLIPTDSGWYLVGADGSETAYGATGGYVEHAILSPGGGVIAYQVGSQVIVAFTEQPDAPFSVLPYAPGPGAGFAFATSGEELAVSDGQSLSLYSFDGTALASVASGSGMAIAGPFWIEDTIYFIESGPESALRSVAASSILNGTLGS